MTIIYSFVIGNCNDIPVWFDWKMLQFKAGKPLPISQPHHHWSPRGATMVVRTEMHSHFMHRQAAGSIRSRK